MGDTCADVFIGDIDDDSLILVQELVLAHLVQGLGFGVDDSLIHIQELLLAHPCSKPHAAQAMCVY